MTIEFNLATEDGNCLFFRMSFKDFTANFGRLEICFLGPDSLGDQEDESEKRKWEGCLFEGAWRRRVNAGGCSNYPGMMKCALD